jgi:hypothetical protein
MKERLFPGKSVLISFIFFMAAAILINGRWIGAAAVTAASGGATIPDMLFSYAPASLAAMFAAMGEAGRAAYLAMNAFDFIFAATYGLFYFFALGWLAMRLFPSLPRLRFVCLVGLAGALFDEIENTLFRFAASGGNRIEDATAAIASFCSTAKYCLNYVSIALIAGGLIGLCMTALARRFFVPR